MAWGGGTRLGLPRAQRKAVVKQSAEPQGEAVLDTRTRTFLLVTAQKGPSFWQARDPRGVVRALGQATLQPRSKLSQIWGKTPWLTQPHRLTALGSPSPHPARSLHEAPTPGCHPAPAGSTTLSRGSGWLWKSKSLLQTRATTPSHSLPSRGQHGSVPDPPASQPERSVAQSRAAAGY